MALRVDSRSGPALAGWAAALALSVAAHVGLVRMNPVLFSGGAGTLQGPSARIRPDMRARPPEPERIREALPRLVDRFTESSDRERLDPTLPDKPSELDFSPGDAAPNFPQSSTDVEPAPISRESPEAEVGSEWSPRQEVLAITDPRVTETLEVLPRAFRDVRRDRPGALDFTVPGDTPEVPIRASGRGPGLPAAFSRGPGLGGGDGVGLGPGPAPVTPVPPEGLDVPEPELEPIVHEPEPTPTEDLLNLAVRVYEDPSEPGARYFKIQLLRNGIESLPALSRDVVFLIDCSASMTETKLQLALEGVRASLETLEEEDRVQVIAFRDRVETFAETLRPATVFGKAQVRTFLTSLNARGQTDVYGSLEALAALPVDAGRPMQALLITDGVPTMGVRDTSRILEKFTTANRGRISVFGLGGGDRVNRRLLDFLSFRNRGASLVSPVAEGLPRVIPLLAGEIRRPVLMDLQVRFTGDTEPEVYPRSLSHLYVDRPWILIGRTRSGEDRLAFQVVGRSVNGDHDIVFPVDLREAPRGGADLKREWAWQAGLQKLADAIAEGSPERLREAEAFFRRYRLEFPDAYRE